MKNDTVFMILKGIGLVGGAMTFAYTGSLGQWANDGTWPATINWHCIIGGTLGAGFSALVAFCSGSVASWRDARKNGDAVPPAPPRP